MDEVELVVLLLLEVVVLVVVVWHCDSGLPWQLITLLHVVQITLPVAST